MSASGSRPAITATTTPVARVTSTGVPVRALTWEKARGSRPSRDMTKKMRLCPYRKARITVGRAMVAARRTG